MYVDPNGPSNNRTSFWSRKWDHGLNLLENRLAMLAWSGVVAVVATPFAGVAAQRLDKMLFPAERPENPPPPIPPTMVFNLPPPPSFQPPRAKEREAPKIKAIPHEALTPAENISTHTQTVLEFGASSDCLVSLIPSNRLPRPPVSVQEREVITYNLTTPEGKSERFEGVKLDDEPIVRVSGEDAYGSYFVVALDLPESLNEAAAHRLAGRCLSKTPLEDDGTKTEHRSKAGEPSGIPEGSAIIAAD